MSTALDVLDTTGLQEKLTVIVLDVCKKKEITDKLLNKVKAAVKLSLAADLSVKVEWREEQSYIVVKVKKDGVNVVTNGLFYIKIGENK